MAMEKVAKYGGRVTKLYGITEFLYKQFFREKEEANKLYKEIQPSLKVLYGQSGRNSEEFKGILNTLVAVAPVGAIGRNFKRRFVENEEGWRKLPTNPDDIPYGYWW